MVLEGVKRIPPNDLKFPLNCSEHSFRSLGNRVRKNGVRNRCPYQRCGVESEFPYRLFSLILCRGESVKSHWFWKHRGSILNFRIGFLSSIGGRLAYPCLPTPFPILRALEVVAKAYAFGAPSAKQGLASASLVGPCTERLALRSSCFPTCGPLHLPSSGACVFLAVKSGRFQRPMALIHKQKTTWWAFRPPKKIFSPPPLPTDIPPPPFPSRASSSEPPPHPSIFFKKPAPRPPPRTPSPSPAPRKRKKQKISETSARTTS